MFSDELMIMMAKDNKRVQDIVGISEERLNYLISECSDEQLSVEMEGYYSRLNNLVFEDESDKEFEKAQILADALRSIDVQHSFHSGVRFKLSDKVIGKPYTVYDLGKLGREDAIFDIHDCVVRISKQRYKLDITGTKRTIYEAYISFKDYSVSSKCRSMQFQFSLDKYPRLFSEIDFCKSKCSMCSKKTFQLYDRGIQAPYNCSLCGKSMRRDSRCEVSMVCYEMTGFSLDELLGACFYAIGVYVNRRKRATDKESSNGVHVCQKVHEVNSKGLAESKLLTIKEYNSYERRERAAYKGGHHSSPVEHERSGYLRHYKNGKVVEIKPTTVNKGKSKAIYEVKG